jgi:amidase
MTDHRVEGIRQGMNRRSVLKGAVAVAAAAATGGLTVAVASAAQKNAPASGYTVGSDEKEFVYTPALILADMIRTRKISPVEVTKRFLDRIDSVNPAINAFVTLVPDQAMAAAKQAEAAVMKKQALGPLHGVPVAVKDVTETKGIRTTYGSLLYKDNVPTVDAIVVERLKKAGAIIIGKTNTPEFTAGASTINKVAGITRNPWNTAYTTGGSSGGSAAGLAAGMFPIATGNDLGGSLRIPASFCGVVGFRTSPGLVPGWPNDLVWDTQNVEGPMARTIGDIALMLQVMAGPDDRIPISLEVPRNDFDFLKAVRNPSIKGARVAWSDNLGLTRIEPETLKVARSSMGVFQKLGCTVEEAAPDFSRARQTALTWRGQRYVALFQDALENNPEFRKLVNPLVVGNVESGLKVSIRDVGHADRERSNLWNRVEAFFQKYDYLVAPTVPIPPFTAETVFPKEINGIPMENYIDWVMLTYAFTLTGLPVISIPCGWTEQGFPVGIQIVGRRHREDAVLKAAAACEQVIAWSKRKPTIKASSKS